MSSTKWGSLKSGKLSILKVDTKEQRDNNSTLVDENKDSELTDLSFSCSSSESNYCDKFFISPEICDVYKDFVRSPSKAKEIVDYFFDSCSSDEEYSKDLEFNFSKLKSNSDLYSVLLQLKRRTKIPWKSESKSKNTLINRPSPAPKHQSPIQIKINKGIESPTLKQYSSDCLDKLFMNKSCTNYSENLVKDYNNEISEENRTVAPVNKLLYKQASPNRIHNRVTETDASIEIPQPPVLSVNAEKKFETEGHLEDIFSKSLHNTKNSPSKDSDNSLVCSQLLDNSSDDPLFSQENKSVVGKPFSDTSLNNCVLNFISDISTEIGFSEHKEDELGKLKERSETDRISLLNSKIKIKEDSSDSKLSIDSKSSSDTKNHDTSISTFRLRKDESDQVHSSNIISDQEDIVNIDSASVHGSSTVRMKNSSSNLVLNKVDENVINHFNGGRQKDFNRTNRDFVIKLSSDSESDTDLHNKSGKMSNPLTIIKNPVVRHVSLSSNDSNSDLEEGTLSLQKNLSVGLQNNFQLDFDTDFFKKNEVWLVQCPKSMNLGNIRGQSLNVPNRTVVHDNGSKYECHVYHGCNIHESMNLVTSTINNKLSLSVVPLAGSVIFEEKVEVPTVTSITINAKRKLPIPDGLKVRHPLLGLDYQDQPKTSIPEDSYKKKKKYEKRESLPVDFDESDTLMNFVFKAPKKKKRKSINEFLEVTSNDASESFQGDISKKKKKKKSRYTDSSFEEETEAIEMSCSKKKKKKKKH